MEENTELHGMNIDVLVHFWAGVPVNEAWTTLLSHDKEYVVNDCMKCLLVRLSIAIVFDMVVSSIITLQVYIPSSPSIR